MDLLIINWLAVFACALASFLFGLLWYQLLFPISWGKELGVDENFRKEGNLGRIFGSSFLLNSTSAVGLALMFAHTGMQLDWKSGMLHGLYIGGFFVATGYGINLVHQKKSFKLFLIDAFYHIIVLSIMGTILGAWH